MPHRHVKPLNLVSDFKAQGDGEFDNVDLINEALEVAADEHRALVVPEGKYSHSNLLYSDGAILIAELGAEFYGSNPSLCAFYMRGNGGVLQGMKFTGPPVTERGGGWKANRIVVSEAAEGWRVERNEVTGGSGTGMYISVDACNGMIRGNYVHDTLADGIHMVERSHHIHVIGNRIRRTGDDGIAVISYAKHGGVTHHIIARDNDVRDNAWGRCMTVVGGTDVLFEHNYIGNNNQSAGFYLHQEGSYDTYACERCTVRRNTVVNCGSIDKGHYAISTSAGPDRPNKDIRIERNLVVIGDPTRSDGNDARSGIDIRSNVLNSIADSNVVQIDTGKPYRLSEGVAYVPYVDGPVGARMLTLDDEGFR
jgi:hypothetical protein